MFCCTSQVGLSREDLVASLADRAGPERVRLLGASDLEATIDALADAFLQDPLSLWLAGLAEDHPDRRELMLRSNRWVSGAMATISLKKCRGVLLGVKEEEEEVDGKGLPLAGAMVAVPSSGSAHLDNVLHWIMYGIRNGSPFPKEGYGEFSFQRSAAMNVLTAKRTQHMSPYPDHIYICQVGVRGASQGSGLGGRMFRTMFGATDSLGVPVYLETESRENEAMYRHLGFETVDTLTLKAKGDTSPDAEFEMYCMLRLPGGAVGAPP